MTTNENQKAQAIFEELMKVNASKTDRLFVFLFGFQYFLGVVLALWVSPYSWAGNESSIHAHVYAAVLLGFFFCSLPIYFNLKSPGSRTNMIVNSIAQSLFSILLIDLTGGRIETHFHVFVSLAFLFSYRSKTPIAIATAIFVLDHLIRGQFWPESVYGVITATNLRTLEHTAWIVFEDVVLLYLLNVSRRELFAISKSQAEVTASNAKLHDALEEVERLNSTLENIVEQRTTSLLETREVLKKQQHSLIASSKMSALGEMAGGIAHEINNPLGIVQGKANLLLKRLNLQNFDNESAKMELLKILAMTERISQIVIGLRSFSRKGTEDDFKTVDLALILKNTLNLCSERFKSHHVALKIGQIPSVNLRCRPVQLEQVLINLLNNAFDAVEHLQTRWVSIDFELRENRVEIIVTDSGPGISPEIADKMMKLFFTTKPEGKGTGLGLSISKNILEAHGGSLLFKKGSANTAFSMELPVLVEEKMSAG